MIGYVIAWTATLAKRRISTAISECVRSSPGVGGGQISGAYRLRTGGPGSYAKNSELNPKSPPWDASDTRLFSGEKRTSHFKRVKSVHDPHRTSDLSGAE